MRSSRALLVAAVVWVSVVTVGSTMVWMVISRAGADVTASQPALGGASPESPSARARGPKIASPSAPISRRPHASSSAGAGGDSPSAAPTTSAPATSGPSAGPRTSAPTRGTSSSGGGGGGGGNPPAVTDRRTWNGVGGSVELKCQGTAISIVSSYANPGYQKIVEANGPQHVELKFVGQGREEHEDEVHAVCTSGGQVSIQSDEHDKSDD